MTLTAARTISNFSSLLSTAESRVASDKLRRLEETFRIALSSGKDYCEACDESSSRRQEFRERDLELLQEEERLRSLIDRTERIIIDSPQELRRQLQEALANSRQELSASREKFVEEFESVRTRLRQTKERFRSDLSNYLKARRLANAPKDDIEAMDREIGQYSSRLPSSAGLPLQEEIRANYCEFGRWNPSRQMAQLKVWIGKYRLLQDGLECDADESQEYRPILYTLQKLSKEYRPGYINAFKEDFACDWGHYIEQAQSELSQILSTTKPRENPGPVVPLDLRSRRRISLREVS